jgi:hypothetical protein
MRIEYKILDRKPESKRSLERRWHRLEEWIHVAQDWNQRKIPVRTVMNLQFS